jgi:hypothetical protein
MIAFVGMETSGQIRRRLTLKGYDTFSCDLLPADDGEDHLHFQCDVFDALERLKMIRGVPSVTVWHPECTYFTGAAEWAFNDPDYVRYPGVGYHQKVKPGTLVGAARRAAREAAFAQFHRIRTYPVDLKVIENPVGAISRLYKPNIIIQPYECGDDASKKTCLWVFDRDGNQINDFPFVIDPAKYVAPTLRPNGKSYWANQTDTGQNRLSPGEDRWKDRSKTYDGIADFIVDAIVRYRGKGQ